MSSTNEQKARIVVFTDCEPDDWLAVGLLNEQTKGMKKIMYVGGTSVDKKMAVAKTFVNYSQEWTVLPGIEEDEGEFCTEWLCSYSPLKKEEEEEERAIFDLDRLVSNLNDANVVYCLKPPTELLLVDEKMDGHDFSHCVLKIYGGYNLRKLDRSVDFWNAFWCQWSNVYLVETFPVIGQRNSFSFDTDRDVFLGVRNNASLFFEHVYNWNRQIYEKKKKSLMEDEAKLNENPEDKKLESGVARKRKIVASIEKCMDSQFLCADPLTVLCPLDWYTKVNLVKNDDSGYPVYETSTVGNLYTVLPNAYQNERRDYCKKRIKSFFSEQVW